MKVPQVSLIDYGVGNLWSVVSAIKYLGAKVDLVSDPNKIASSSVLLLPGIGSFRKGMEDLKNTGIDKAILHAVQNNNAKILGICMGMQLMGSYGSEDGGSEGLALIPNRVERFNKDDLHGNKIPHVGFNVVDFSERKGLFKGLPKSSDFYFTHSYYLKNYNVENVITETMYDLNFVSSINKRNIYGVQFHPEKSQSNGLKVIKNFYERC